MNAAIGSSHAKIILIGEHAVVYQEPAIALPIPTIRLRAEVTPTPTGTQQITSAFYTGSLAAASQTRFAGIATLVRQLLVRFDALDAGFHLNIISDLPPERGMGSSAATAVAVIRAFYAAFAAPLDHATTLRWAEISERIIHGDPSGIDAATTCAANPQWVVRGHVPQSVALPHKGVLVIADTGIQGQTAAAVAVVAERIAAGAVKHSVIHRLGDLTRTAAVAMAESDLLTLGATMNAAHTDLVTLGVSVPLLDQFVAAAKTSGALGAKLTGSGLGGCMIALAADGTAATKIVAALTAAGATQTWQYDFS